MSNLFKEAEDWQNTAIVHHSRDKWLYFSEGYKKAYNIIMSNLTENKRDRDFLIYPLLYLHRHYLELILKEIIVLGSILNNNPIEVPQGNHDLMRLWNQSQDILKVFQGESYNAPSQKISNKINEFHNTDHNSQSFRYPVNRNGDSNLNDLERINYRHFRDEFKEVEYYLEGIANMLYVAKDEIGFIRGLY